MKKTFVGLMSIVSLLAVCACNLNDNSNEPKVVNADNHEVTSDVEADESVKLAYEDMPRKEEDIDL